MGRDDLDGRSLRRRCQRPAEARRGAGAGAVLEPPVAEATAAVRPERLVLPGLRPRTRHSPSARRAPRGRDVLRQIPPTRLP